MDTLFTLATLAAAVRLAVPVAVAALGEVLTERSGVLNLGLEGTMLFGALAGYLAALATGSPWIGLAAGLGAGAACGAVLALLMVVIRADQIVTGLAFTLFAGSATTYLFEQSATIGQAPPRIVGLDMPPLLAIVAVLLVAVWFLLARTSTGLVLSAAGDSPAAVDALGYRVGRVRTAATTAGSALGGLAGAMLVCGPLGLFVQNVTAGRGWVALALVVFARWRPGRAVVGALLFGLCDAAQMRLQGTATEIPYEVFLALPYLVTLVALVIRARRSGTPTALAVPFVRGSG
jgi:general nucleoside transport system permease protein